MGSYESAPTVGWDMTYDGLSRLTAVQGRRGGAIFAGDTMSYTYDSMGNLLSKSISTAAGTESSTYNVPTTTNTVSTESYDDNGNQTTSAADGVASIDYNILNLPQSVSLSDSTKVYYLYSASGSKLKEVVVPGGEGETETTDYTGNLIYKNGTLHKVLTNGGYIETGDSTLALLNRPAYRYFLTDHLGSVRVVADAQGHVLQQNSQLPYGEDYTPVYASGHAQGGGFTPLPGEPPTGGGSGSGYDEEFEDEGEDGETSGGTSTLEPDSYYRSYNPYKFSGNEQIKSGHYDFGARWYSPRTARWSTQDPLAEKYHSISPYAYCAGNPINLVDPNGMNWYSYADSTGTTQYKYVEGQLSEEEIKSNNYKDLGFTYYDNESKTYYSLFGEVVNMTNDSGKFLLSSILYYDIDQLIINAYTVGGGLGKWNFYHDVKPGVYGFSYNGKNFNSKVGIENGTLYNAISDISQNDLSIKIMPKYGPIFFGGDLYSPQWYGHPMIFKNKSGFDVAQINFDTTNAVNFLNALDALFRGYISLNQNARE